MDDVADLTRWLWDLAGASASPLGSIEVTGDRHVFASVFDVTGLAAASVGAATAAIAEVVAARTGRRPPSVAVDTRAACAAFVGETLFTPRGWQRAATWDPIAGDYRAGDGWIRLHTNYTTHRRAALAALDLPDSAATDRDAVAAAVGARAAAELEEAIVEHGGAAAAMHALPEWRAHHHGAASRDEPPVRVMATTHDAASPSWVGVRPRRPLAGVRVLDLTRVIAGPVATRFLAAHGANVVRIDSPGFAEVPALVPVVTPGKRCASLDLIRASDRARFLQLLETADVVVHGLRPGAMEGLGFGPDALRAVQPGLVTARLDAYGWSGPWAGRRGFDSLVQMSCGVAAAGAQAAGADHPVPLPAQALDHATGYLVAAAVGRALANRLRSGHGADVTASLLGTAGLLMSRPVPPGTTPSLPDWDDRDRVAVTTAWGPADAVPSAGVVAGWPACYEIEAGPLGRHDACW